MNDSLTIDALSNYYRWYVNNVMKPGNDMNQKNTDFISTKKDNINKQYIKEIDPPYQGNGSIFNNTSKQIKARN